MPTRIREATYEDFPILIDMGRMFFAESGYGDLIEFDPDSAEQTINMLIESDSGILLVAEKDKEVVGMVGALLYPFYFNLSHITGQELFWWVRPELRGGRAGYLLLRQVEAEAKSRGATTFSMIALDSVSPEIAGGIYIKSGYRASEYSYIKRL